MAREIGQIKAYSCARNERIVLYFILSVYFEKKMKKDRWYGYIRVHEFEGRNYVTLDMPREEHEASMFFIFDWLLKTWLGKKVIIDIREAIELEPSEENEIAERKSLIDKKITPDTQYDEIKEFLQKINEQTQPKSFRGKLQESIVDNFLGYIISIIIGFFLGLLVL